MANLPQPQYVNLTQKHIPYVKEWRLYASMNLVIIGLANGLPPDGDRPLSKPMFFVLVIEHTGTNLSENLNQQPINFSREKGFSKNVVCEKPAILSQPQCVNLTQRQLPKSPSCVKSIEYDRYSTRNKKAFCKQFDPVQQYKKQTRDRILGQFSPGQIRTLWVGRDNITR